MKYKFWTISFHLLILVTILGAAPAFGQTSNQVNIAVGASSPNSDCITAINCYYPNPINVIPADTVTWINNDQLAHTITSGKVSDNNPGDMFDSGLIKSGQSFQFTFKTVGTYDYFCTVHPWMTGQIVVGVTSDTNVTINNPHKSNQPPVAKISDISPVNPGNIVTLDGSQSYDPDKSPSSLTYLWSQTGEPKVEILDSKDAITTFVAPQVDQSTVLRFQLTVSDGILASTTYTAVIINPVTNNTIPDWVKPVLVMVAVGGGIGGGIYIWKNPPHPNPPKDKPQYNIPKTSSPPAGTYTITMDVRLEWQ